MDRYRGCGRSSPDQVHHPSHRLGTAVVVLLWVFSCCGVVMLWWEHGTVQQQQQQLRDLFSENTHHHQLEGGGGSREESSLLGAGGPTSATEEDHKPTPEEEEEEELHFPTKRRQSQETGNTSNPTLVIQDSRKPHGGPTEARSIRPIDIPFLQDPGAFRLPGNGISLQALGEPKSGTTWLGRVVPQLALELCGSYNNLWCEMGGLVVNKAIPAAWYEFEMLNRSSHGPSDNSNPTLFLHYKGRPKHIIPGMDDPEVHRACHHGGEIHRNSFIDHPACLLPETPTRERLEACLWDNSPRCLSPTASIDPAVGRSMVIFREPRDVILSEYIMRTQVFIDKWVSELSLVEYIEQHFEILVSWIHQRWVWHTSAVFAPSSHIVYYDECQGSHLVFIEMAAFMGLECSPEQAFKVWKSHRNPSPHGNYKSHPGLQPETIEWMTAVMAKLLPPPLALRWGVTPTDLPPN